jgi:hypothetical protein
MYNLTVDTAHTFFVGELGWLVHNQTVLPKPVVTDPKLQNYVDNLYKGTTNPNLVGTGTTMDAVRNEIVTGLPTEGTFHTTKAQETITGLTKWIKNNPNASYQDKIVANSLLNDLQNALRGCQ